LHLRARIAFIYQLESLSFKVRQTCNVWNVEHYAPTKMGNANADAVAVDVGECSAQGEVVLSVRGLKRCLKGQTLWEAIDFDVCAGEVLFIRGASGVGKSLLLRATAQLDPYEVCVCVLRARVCVVCAFKG
jgi:ABC-type uncharacterized transport system ATPase subunit